MKRIESLSFLLIVFLIIFSGCGKLETEKSITKYVMDEYGIEVEVISKDISHDNTVSETYSEHIIYQMQEKERNIIFNW